MKILQKIKFSSIIWILFYIFIFVFIFNKATGNLDPDFGWHLKTGQEILTTGQIPHINTVNYPLNGNRWVDHEWLANIIIYLIFSINSHGYLILAFLFSLIAVLIFILLSKFIINEVIKNRNGLWLVIPLEILGLMAIAPHIGLRIQEITVLNLFLLFLITYFYNKNKNYKILYLMPLLFYFWANVHGGFLIGFFFLATFVTCKFAELILKQKYHTGFLSSIIDYNQNLNKKQILLFTIFSIASFLVTLATPYGVELYSFLSDYKNTYYLTHIIEWLPQWSSPLMYWQIIYIALVFSIIIANLILVLNQKDDYKNDKKIEYKINLWETAIILFFAIMAIKSHRHVPLFFVISLPLIIKNLMTSIKIDFSLDFIKNNPAKIIIKSFSAICLIMLIFNFSATTNYKINDPFQYFCQSRGGIHYPCAGINFLKEHKEYEDLNIFNEYGWGGFMIWAYPERKLFIDGRMPQINYNGRSFLEEYDDLRNKDKIAQKFFEHNIRLVLARKPGDKKKIDWVEKYIMMVREDQIKEPKNEMIEYLKNNQGWEKIYEDEVCLIYVQK
jgi:hypothetical protein